MCSRQDPRKPSRFRLHYLPNFARHGMLPLGTRGSHGAGTCIISTRKTRETTKTQYLWRVSQPNACVTSRFKSIALLYNRFLKVHSAFNASPRSGESSSWTNCPITPRSSNVYLPVSLRFMHMPYNVPFLKVKSRSPSCTPRTTPHVSPSCLRPP